MVLDAVNVRHMTDLETFRLVLANALATTSILSVVAWLGRHWITTRIRESIKHEYDTALERLRADHQRGFVLYELRLNALRALTRLHSDLVPEMDHRDADWFYSLSKMDFGRALRELSEFLANYAPFIPANERKRLREAEAWAREAQFLDCDSSTVKESASHVYDLVSRALHAVELAVLDGGSTEKR